MKVLLGLSQKTGEVGLEGFVVNDSFSQDPRFKYGRRVLTGMKRTSSLIAITGQTDETGAATFTEEQVNLQLNALDREVFVVTDVVMSCPAQPIPSVDAATPSGNYRNSVTAVLAASSATSVDLNSSNVIAWVKKDTQVQWDTAANISLGALLDTEGYQAGQIDGESNYLSIIATPDFYVRLISGGFSPAVGKVNWRVYGYRAQADAATYAALVQSEVLSE